MEIPSIIITDSRQDDSGKRVAVTLTFRRGEIL